MRLLVILSLTLSLFLHIPSAYAEGKAEESFGPRPLDGVVIEALETYRNPKVNQLGLNLGVWPFNAYYTGFSLTGDYTYLFDKTYAWEVVQGTYLYTVDKNLTSQLAQNYGVNPIRIERINYALSSNILYYHSYGKFILLKEYIRYFRSAFLGGVGLVSTNFQSNVALSLGWKFEVHVNDAYSWNVDIRDLMTFSGEITNNVAFNFGAAYSF